MTTSNGRGAREDQCSCFDTAISAHMPESKTGETGKRNKQNVTTCTNSKEAKEER